MSQNGQTHFKNLAAFDHFCTLCTKGLKVKKMSVPKTEGESLLFHIGNDFPNMISVTSEVGFYVKVSQLRNLYPQKQLPEVFCEKKAFLEMSQNSQENACNIVSFLLNLQASGLQRY